MMKLFWKIHVYVCLSLAIALMVAVRADQFINHPELTESQALSHYWPAYLGVVCAAASAAFSIARGDLE